MISLEDVVDHPPIVHGGLTTWGISVRLARFLDAQLTPQSTTLETGAGLSTILFLRRGVARHISITPYEPEFKAIRTYCAEVGIDTGALQAPYPVAAVRVIKAGPLRRVLGLARAAWNEPELVRRKLRALASGFLLLCRRRRRQP